MNKIANQKGFSAVIAIITVVVIAALAFGGWYVWRQNRDTANNDSPQTEAGSQNAKADETQQGSQDESERFICKDTFSIAYPTSLQAAVTDAGQCLISNVSVEDMPAVGPLPPNQLGLFFSVQNTEVETDEEYLEDYIERSQEDSPLELKAQQEVRLDDNTEAILTTLYGGHPTPHDFYFFVYVKNGKAITTSYPVESEHKEVALEVLRSIQMR